MDLMLYKHGDLINNSFFLMVDHFSQLESLVKNLKNIQILESPLSIASFKKAFSLISDFRKKVEGAENWLGLTKPEDIFTAACVMLASVLLGNLCMLEESDADFMLENVDEDDEDDEKDEKSKIDEYDS